MGRSLTSAMLSEIGKTQVSPAVLVRLDFPDGVIRRWTGLGTITHENETYSGGGDLIEIGDIEETVALRATGMRVGLTGISPSFLNTVLSQNYQGREAKLWVGALDSSGGLIVGPTLFFVGRIDNCEVDESAASPKITVHAESRLIDLRRSRERRYTEWDQKQDYPNDKGFEYVTYLQEEKTFPDQIVVVRRHTTFGPFSGTSVETTLDVLDGPRPLTIQSPTSPRRLIYGRLRRGGTVVFAHFVSATSLQLVVALCEGEIQEIESGIYVDEKEISLDSSGVPFGAFNTSTSISASSTDNAFNTTANNFFLYPPGALIETRGFDNEVNNGFFRVSSSTPSKIMVDGVNLVDEPAGAPSKTIEDPTFLRTRFVLKKHLGGPDQAADSRLTGLTSKWTGDHRLRGVAYVHVGVTLDERIFPAGVPNITVIVKGRKVYDPRNATTAYATNAALCLRDYIQDLNAGLGEIVFLDYGLIANSVDVSEEYEDLVSTMTSSKDYGSVGESAALIDDGDVATAADICDEDVSLAGGGTEKRYTVNGVIDLSQPRMSIIRQLVDAMAGRLFYAEGQWHMTAGKYVAPTVSLDESDLRGDVRIMTRRSREHLVNAVRGTYIDANNRWQPTDFPNVVSASRQEEDGQERFWGDMNFNLVASAATAQRLAKIAIERNHQHIAAILPCKLTALKLRAGDTVKITNARLGWADKVFEVDSVKLVFQPDRDNAVRLGVDLAVRELDSSVYDWTPATDETRVSAAPTTTLDPRAFTQVLADVGGAMKNEAQEWTQAQNFDAVTLTDGGTIGWNVGAQQVASVTLGGDRTLANPTNMADGGNYILTVRQDGAGDRTLAYGSAYKWPGGAAPTLSTDAGAIDILYFISDGTSMYGTQQLDFS